MLCSILGFRIYIGPAELSDTRARGTNHLRVMTRLWRDTTGIRYGGNSVLFPKGKLMIQNDWNGTCYVYVLDRSGKDAESMSMSKDASMRLAL